MSKDATVKISIDLLKEVYDLIEENIADEEISLEGNGRLTYCLYLRASEIFVSIIALLDANISTTATILLRPLCETLALLETSIRNEGFSEQYLKKALEEKKNWAEKILKIDLQGLAVEKDEILDLKRKTESELEGLNQDLKSTKRILEDLDPLIYYHVYAQASLYVHSNAFSMSMYFNEDNSVIPTTERDDSGRYRHVSLSAARVFIRTYDLMCERIGRKERLTEQLTARLEEVAAWFKRDAESH